MISRNFLFHSLIYHHIIKYVQLEERQQLVSIHRYVTDRKCSCTNFHIIGTGKYFLSLSLSLSLVTTPVQLLFVTLDILFYFRVNKNCLKWAQNYFTTQLVGLEAEKNGNTASITKMVECTGDVDLNQRKGKIITIYDVVLKLNWKGKVYL